MPDRNPTITIFITYHHHQSSKTNLLKRGASGRGETLVYFNAGHMLCIVGTATKRSITQRQRHLT
jgi:hypothetical protein